MDTIGGTVMSPRAQVTSHLVRRVLIFLSLLAGAFVGYALCSDAAHASSGTDVPVQPAGTLTHLVGTTVDDVARPLPAPVRQVVMRVVADTPPIAGGTPPVPPVVGRLPRPVAGSPAPVPPPAQPASTARAAAQAAAQAVAQAAVHGAPDTVSGRPASPGTQARTAMVVVPPSALTPAVPTLPDRTSNAPMSTSTSTSTSSGGAQDRAPDAGTAPSPAIDPATMLGTLIQLVQRVPESLPAHPGVRPD